MVRQIMIRKNTLMNLFPFNIASLAPNAPPKALHTAIGKAIAHMIFPLSRKKQIEPKLVARFTNLALADAFRKSKPSMLIKAIMRKLPAPGPIKPS